MKGLKIFLSYYSLVVITVVIVVSAFFLARPQGIITAFALIPVNFLIWFFITNPEKTDAARWSLRLVIVVFLLSGLGVYGYFLSAKMTPSEPMPTPLQAVSENPELNNKIEELKAELQSLKEKSDSTSGTGDADNLINILGDNTPASGNAIGKLTIKNPQNGSINVYEQPSLASKIIGRLDYGQNYSFLERTNDWYLVEFSPTETGYIQASQVTEIQ